jgi:hypothetical protein
LACAKETFKSCPQDKKVAAKVADDAGHSRRTREIAHERRKATASVARRVVICGGRFVPPLGEAKAFVDVEAVLARGLVLALLLIVLAVSAVSILTVTSKDRAQRSDGIKVLRLLGRMLKDLLNTLRRGGRGEPPAA